MKRKDIPSPRKFKTNDPKLGILSLVDVIFLLLVFFLVVTFIGRREEDLVIKQRA